MISGSLAGAGAVGVGVSGGVGATAGVESGAGWAGVVVFGG